MRDLDKVKVFDVYKMIKLPAINEELSAIIILDLEALSFIMSKDLLERALMECDNFSDVEAYKMV